MSGEPAAAALTDFDGTLADTRSANRIAYGRAFEECGEVFDAERYDAAFGLRFDDLCDALIPNVGPDARRAIALSKTRHYRELHSEVVVNTGLSALLAGMKSAGLPVGLVTTASRINVMPLLTYLHLADLFEVVITAEDVQRAKPSPDGYLEGARRLGHPPARTVVFEDSEVGITAARAAGCPVVKVEL